MASNVTLTDNDRSDQCATVQPKSILYSNESFKIRIEMTIKLLWSASRNTSASGLLHSTRTLCYLVTLQIYVSRWCVPYTHTSNTHTHTHWTNQHNIPCGRPVRTHSTVITYEHYKCCQSFVVITVRINYYVHTWSNQFSNRWWVSIFCEASTRKSKLQTNEIYFSNESHVEICEQIVRANNFPQVTSHDSPTSYTLY